MRLRLAGRELFRDERPNGGGSAIVVAGLACVRARSRGLRAHWSFGIVHLALCIAGDDQSSMANAQ
jgi:hypothetical protein